MSFGTPRDPLQQALHCVTPARFDAPREYPADISLKLAIGDVEPVRLSGDYPLLLSATIRFDIIADALTAHRVNMRDYEYVRLHGDGRELLVYHWHPESRSNVTFPHLHVKAGTDLRRAEFAKAHIPTGWIPFQDVIWLAITQFGAKTTKKDWAAVLRRTRVLKHLPVDDGGASSPT